MASRNGLHGRSRPRRLRLLRIGRGLLQADLARLTGIPQPRISRLERGDVAPADHEREALSRLFGRSPSSLFRFIELSSAAPPQIVGGRPFTGGAR